MVVVDCRKKRNKVRACARGNEQSVNDFQSRVGVWGFSVNPPYQVLLKLIERTNSVIPPQDLFALANSSWQDSHPTTPSTDQFPLNLPSQCATAVLGNNLVLAMGRHIEDALSLFLMENKPTEYKAVACQPRIPRPRRPFPPLFSGGVSSPRYSTQYIITHSSSYR